MDETKLPYVFALNCIERLAGRRVLDILNEFQGDPEAAWKAGPEWTIRNEKMNSYGLSEIKKVYEKIDPDKLYRQYLDAGCKVTVYGDEDYPQMLSQIYDPPLLLFYYGELPEPDEICITVIGTRKCTNYGKQVAEIFARDLAEQGIVIVGGMARGIDSAGHRGALNGGGKTVAVLGSGLDVIYPPENDKLYAQICANGAVVSEFPLGTGPLARNFPRRNRIMSGFSQGILVVEAGEKSGTSLTVDYALQQGRDVFAVPGPVTASSSKGTNRLLKQGAKFALCAEDIRSEYCSEPPKVVYRKKTKEQDAEAGITGPEQKLMELLQTPMRLDEIQAEEGIDMDVSQLSVTLTLMEIRGLVRQLPGNYYQTVVKTIRA